MSEFLNYQDNCKLDIAYMEAAIEFDNRYRLINIDVLSGEITQENALKDIGSSITKFIKSIIEKIADVLSSVQKKIKEKMMEWQFQNQCSFIKKNYATYKTQLNSKDHDVYIIDYMKYKKKASELVKEYHSLIMGISKLKPDEDAYDYVISKGKEIDKKYMDGDSDLQYEILCNDMSFILLKSGKYVSELQKVQEDLVKHIQAELDIMNGMDITLESVMVESPEGIRSDLQRAIKYIASSLLKFSQRICNFLGKGIMKMMSIVRTIYNKITHKNKEIEKDAADIRKTAEKIDKEMDNVEESVDDFDVFNEASTGDYMALNKALNIEVKGNIKRAKQAMKSGNKMEAKHYLNKADRALSGARDLFHKYVDESRQDVGTMISSNLILSMSSALKSLAIIVTADLIDGGKDNSIIKAGANLIVCSKKLKEVIDTMGKLYTDVKNDDVSLNTFNLYIAKIESAMNTLGKTINKLKTSLS